MAYEHELAFPGSVAFNKDHKSVVSEDCSAGGMTLLDYFAIRMEVTEKEIENHTKMDGYKNPTNEIRKGPLRRSRDEIISDLKYEKAYTMLKRRKEFMKGI